MYKRGFDSLNQDTSESYVSACPETWVCKDSVLSFDFFFCCPTEICGSKACLQSSPRLVNIDENLK